MALFSKKALHNIEKHNSAKSYGILLKYKGFESLGSGFIISEKKFFLFWGWPMPWGPQFCTSWAKKLGNF